MADTTSSSLDAARRAADRDELGQWVTEFLASPGSDNAPLADELRRRWPIWLGPVRLPLDHLHRLAGPSDHPVLVEVDDDEWRDDVDDLKDEIEEGWEPPPLVVTYQDGQLVLEDGNHRVEGLRRAGESHGWAVIGFDDEADRDAFTVPSIASTDA